MLYTSPYHMDRGRFTRGLSPHTHRLHVSFRRCTCIYLKRNHSQKECKKICEQYNWVWVKFCAQRLLIEYVAHQKRCLYVTNRSQQLSQRAPSQQLAPLSSRSIFLDRNKGDNEEKREEEGKIGMKNELHKPLDWPCVSATAQLHKYILFEKKSLTKKVRENICEQINWYCEVIL